MKRLTFLLLMTLIGISGLTAQIDSTQFLFKKFQDATVYYKDGRLFGVQMNYNLVAGCFLFIDVHDNNEMKRFAEPKLVGSIKIGDRIFLPTDNGATEILQANPAIHVEYKGTIREEDKRSGYGGRSATSAIQTYSSIQSGGVMHGLDTEKNILTDIYKIYYVEKKGKKARFITEKQFLKIFSAKKEELKRYIRDKGIDFDSTIQVTELCNHALNLK